MGKKTLISDDGYVQKKGWPEKLLITVSSILCILLVYLGVMAYVVG